jgi:choice-of-anchor B domain-containing protein
MRRIYSIIAIIIFSCNLQAQDNLNVDLVSNFKYNVGLNDIWGYSDGQNEYALVGTYDGLSVVDVSNPSQPKELAYINTVNSIWKDIKTYSHYAYITHGIYSSSDVATGLLIVDLNTINQENPLTYNFKIEGEFETAHNLFIDEGIAYLFGVNEIGGALILDLKEDATSPKVLSHYTGHYLHDGYVKDGILYGCADKNGYFVMVDVTDLTNAKDIVTSDTPNRTTHSAWLSNDGNTLFTTDERISAFITSFDVSDPDNITQLDVVRTKNTEKSIPHNTFLKGNHLVSSYYAQGIQIVDASQPDNLVEVGRYDSSPDEKSEFNGAWGVYPFLPSGLILLSDTETGLHILKPNYTRASYLEGQVKSANDNSLIYNAEVAFVDYDVVEFSNFEGEFKSGLHIDGLVNVKVSKEGYEDLFTQVELINGQVQATDFSLVEVDGADEDELITDINVYPNPFKNFLQVDYSFAGSKESRSEIYLYNSKGQVVYQKDLNSSKGSVTIDKDLNPGVYFVQIFNGTMQSKSLRVVKN